MAGKMEAVQRMLFLSVNKVMSEGAELPLPRFAQDDLTNSQLTPYDSYLLVESDPNVHRYVNEETI